MIIYNYDSITLEYIGESEARLDPEETRIQKKEIWLLPLYATFIKPIKVAKNKVAVFVNDKWIEAHDYRGQLVYSKDNPVNTFIVNAIGSIPSEYTLIAPACEFPKWDVDKGWVVDTVAQEAAIQEAAIQEEMKSITVAIREQAIANLAAKQTTTVIKRRK